MLLKFVVLCIIVSYVSYNVDSTPPVLRRLLRPVLNIPRAFRPAIPFARPGYLTGGSIGRALSSKPVVPGLSIPPINPGTLTDKELQLGLHPHTSKADTVFIKNARNTMIQADKMFQIRKCIEDAREKARSLGYTDGDMHFAISWISMYSRYCRIPEIVLDQDRDVNNFPFRLNKELRCMFNPKRNRQVQDFFQRVSNTIDESLQKKGPQIYPTTYRGLTFNPYDGQAVFVEEGFSSSSLSLEVALRFAKGTTLTIVEDFYGVSIADFAEDRFKYQAEVLGLTKSVFAVYKIIKETTEIDKLIDKLLPSLPPGVKKPSEVIYARQVRNANLNKVESVIKLQHQKARDYSDPNYVCDI